MKIKKEVPQQWRGPVFITEEKYEIWASTPVKLGEIVKQGNYWRTQDGMRFISSQDASEYMLRLADKKIHASGSLAAQDAGKTEVPSRVREAVRKAVAAAREGRLSKKTPAQKHETLSTRPQLNKTVVRRPKKEVELASDEKLDELLAEVRKLTASSNKEQ